MTVLCGNMTLLQTYILYRLVHTFLPGLRGLLAMQHAVLAAEQELVYV